MNTHGFAMLAAIAGLALPAAAPAQDSDGAAEDLDLTIRLMPEGSEDGREITRTITLPESVPERVPRTVPGEDAGAGRDASDEPGGPGNARPPEGIDAPGLDIAEQARSGEDGRELGRELRERALENREDAGRGGGPPAAGVPAPDTPGGDAGPPEDLPDAADTPEAERPGDGVPDTPDPDEPMPDTPGDAGPSAELPEQAEVPGDAGG